MSRELTTKMLRTVVLCAFVAIGAYASPGGAPVTACNSMTPVHGSSPQTGPAPYVVTATAIDADRYEVSITTTAADVFFRGFLIEGRSTATDTAVGTFDASANSKSIDCGTTAGSAATHIDNTDKSSATIIWNAPASGEAVEIVASIVQNTSTYWVKLPVTIVKH